MKIAIIENYSCECSYMGRPRRNDDDLYCVEYSYVYNFYSDAREISIEKYKIIHEYLNTLNKSFNKTVDYRVSNETYKKYDIVKSNLLASQLDCQIFEPGISPLNVFQHKLHSKNIGIIDKSNSQNWEICSTEIIEYPTLPILKYVKLIKGDKFWEGVVEHPWSKIYLDDDDNLCYPSSDYHHFRVNTILADKIYLPYNKHDKNTFQSLSHKYAIVIKGNLWGVIDSTGHFVVKHQPYKIIEIYDSFCIIEHIGCYSCMNFEGEILMPFISQEFGLYYDRYVEILYNDLKFLYDLQLLKFILIASYKELYNLNKNLTIVRNTCGLIDIYNHDSLKLYENLLEVSDILYGKMIVCKSKQGWIVCDLDGNRLFVDAENKYTSVKVTNDGHIRLVQKKPNNYLIYGLANNNGHIIFPCYSDSPIKIFQNKGDFYYILKKFKKEYLCNDNKVLSSKYDLIKRGQEGICIAYNGLYRVETDRINFYDGQFYAITLDGNIKFSLKTQNLFSFKNGLASIMQNNKYGKVDLDGKIVIPPMYDSLGMLSNGLIAACINDKWGYIDYNNNIIIEFKYDRVNSFDEKGKAYVESNGYCATINTAGEIIHEWERILGFSSQYSDSIDYDTYIRDGLAEAFNDEPANYWNID